MSFLGDLWGGLFGGEARDADWDQIEKLMQMSAELNRTDRHGYFSNWDWTEDENGKWTQSHTLKPGLDIAADRLLSRANGEGYLPYQSPGQFSSLLDAKMANQMQRHGILDDEAMKTFSLQQSTFGDRAGDRQGGWLSRYRGRMPEGKVNPYNPQPQQQQQQQQPPQQANPYVMPPGYDQYYGGGSFGSRPGQRRRMRKF